MFIQTQQVSSVHLLQVLGLSYQLCCRDRERIEREKSPVLTLVREFSSSRIQTIVMSLD